MEKSRLLVDGSTMNNIGLEFYVQQLSQAIKKEMNQDSLVIHIWPYREGNNEFLACDIFKSETKEIGDFKRKAIPITISAINENSLSSLDNPIVYDMTEAIHLAGLLSRKLNAKIILGRESNIKG